MTGTLVSDPWLFAARLCSLCSLTAFCLNLPWYRAPRSAVGLPAPVSILIPARNEEFSIAAAMESVLAQQGIAFELLVMDDSSADRTAEVAEAFAARDPRVRVVLAPRLPEGWNGKQHACFALAKLAR